MHLRRRTATLLLGAFLLAGGLTVPTASTAAAATYSCASPSQNWIQIGAYTRLPGLIAVHRASARW